MALGGFEPHRKYLWTLEDVEDLANLSLVKIQCEANTCEITLRVWVDKAHPGAVLLRDLQVRPSVTICLNDNDGKCIRRIEVKYGQFTLVPAIELDCSKNENTLCKVVLTGVSYTLKDGDL